MVIRRNDARRRRVGVLIDEHSAPVEVTTGAEVAQKERSTKSEAKKESKPAGAYGVAAQRRHLAKTTDFIPKRLLPCAIFALVLLTLLGALNGLYFYATNITEFVGTKALKIFSLTDQGSLSQWFTTMLLVVSGMASLQIYALRQHRSDDYRGTYRLWLWFSILLLVASVDSAVGLHDLVINSISSLTGTSLSQGGWALITIKLIALTGLVARGLVEVRSSRGAIVAVLFVWFAYAGAILMQLPHVKNGVVLEYEPVYGNLILFGTTALLLSIFTYARFVYLQAQGLLVMKEAKAAIVKATKQAKSSAKANAKAEAKANAKAKSKTKVELKTKSKSESDSKSPTKRKKATKKAVDKPEPELTFATAKGPGNRKSSKKAKARRVQQVEKVEEPAEERESGKPELRSLPLGSKLKSKSSKLSKSERRSLRKAEKQQRRAA